MNLQSNAAKGQLCWTFDVMTKGITGASIRDSAGMVVAKLGIALQGEELRDGPDEGARHDRVEARARTRSGSTRRAIRATCAGKLFAGMAHMSDEGGDDETHAEQPSRGGRPRPCSSATVVGGVSSLFWGKAVWGHVSSAIAPVEALRPARPDERLADLHRLRLDADVRPGDVAARRSAGTSSSRSSLAYDELRALPKVEQISTFHCVTGWTVKNVHWGGVRLNDVLALRQPEAGRARARVRLGREAVRRLPHDAAGGAARRDARLRDGREAAPARARRAAAARDPRDVRLQERQVAERDQPRRRRRRTATGSSSATTATPGSAARTGTARERRLPCAASRAPSARCTGRTRSASSSCSRPG